MKRLIRQSGVFNNSEVKLIYMDEGETFQFEEEPDVTYEVLENNPTNDINGTHKIIYKNVDTNEKHSIIVDVEETVKRK